MFAMGFDVAFGGSDPAVNSFVGKPKFNNTRPNKPTTVAGNPFSFLSLLTSLFGQLVNLGRQLRDLLSGIRWPSSYGAGNAEVVWDPSVVARAEAEDTAKTVALSPPPAATQPIIEGGVVPHPPWRLRRRWLSRGVMSGMPTRSSGRFGTPCWDV